MRKTFSIILLIILTISLTGCGGGKQSGKQSYSDPVYEVKIQEDVQASEMIDVFAKNGSQFFSGPYPDLVYTEFFYEGNLDSLSRVNGDMQITYVGTDPSGLLDSTKKLVAEYSRTTRHIAYYVLESSDKIDGKTTPISSTHFQQVAEKIADYLNNLGISSGYIEMTEYAVEGHWIVYHYPVQGKNADVQLKIDAVTLELIEYNQNP